MTTVLAFISRIILAVPVRVKITGIVLLPVLILGFTINYWVTRGLSNWLSYILVDTRVEAAMSAGSRSVLLVTFLATILSLLLSTLLTIMLTHPLIALQKTARQVAAGNFKTRAAVWADDEIGALATSVNAMIDQFDQYQIRLANTNKQLQIINSIAMASDRGDEIHDQEQQMLFLQSTATCQYLLEDLPAAEAKFNKALEIAHFLHLPTHEALILNRLSAIKGDSGAFDEALEYGQRVLEIASTHELKQLAGEQHVLQGLSAQELNRLQEAQAHLETASQIFIDLARPDLNEQVEQYIAELRTNTSTPHH